MSENEELSDEEVTKNQGGVLLGLWDYEKTPILIQDLEHSIGIIEQKCKYLLEELIYYKKYLEESEGPETYLAVLKKKDKRSKNSHFFSGSDPDIAFRKNLISLQETQQIFEEKFQEKLVSLDRDLRAADRKLGLYGSVILFPTDDYLDALNKQIEQKTRESWNDVRDGFIKLNRFKTKTRSDSVIADLGDNEQVAKITKNDLELYQKLSRLSLKSGRRTKPKSWKMISFRGRKLKFCCRKVPPQFFQSPKQEPNDTNLREKKQKRQKKRVVSAPPERKTHAPRCPDNPSNGSNEQGARGALKPLTEVTGKKQSKEGLSDEKVSWGAVLRKTVPFTACTSTARSYNIGLNMQQLLSLSKRRGKSSGGAPLRQKSPEGSREQGGSCCKRLKVKTEVEKRQEPVPWVPGSKSDGFDCDVTQIEETGKIWMRNEGASSNLRKMRSKYTGRCPEGFMEYHKSTMSQFTNGQKSMIKSESKSAYAVGSKIMVSGCERTDVFEVEKGEHFLGNASGDGTCNEKLSRLSTEWTKVYGCFLNTYRKYTSLKEKLSDKNSAPSNDELKSLENEIDHAIEKYKDFLQFYSKFLHLKHRLKSLKIACETKLIGPVTPFSSNCHRTTDNCRPTYSMAMKKALKEVQALQDKIRLVTD